MLFFLLGVAVTCSAVAAVHWPVLSAQALCFDDREFLADNPLVQNPSLANAGRFLSEVFNPSTVGGYYIPLTMISLMVDYALGGRPGDLRAFHRTNLLLHLLTTAAIAVLLMLLFNNPWVAMILALLYGLHPLTVEPIAWIGERKTVLATCLAVWAMIAHLLAVRRGEGKLIAVATILFVLSMLAKPTTTTLPVLLMLLDYWPLRRLGRRAFAEKIPYFSVAAVMAMLTVLSNARGRDISVAGHASEGPLLLRICHNLMLYGTKMIVPTELTPYYPPPDPFDLSNISVLGGLLGTVMLVVGVWVSLRWTRCWAAGLGFFLIAISPTLGIIEFSWILASDKYVYFPVIGLLLPLAWTASRFWDHRATWRLAFAFLAAASATIGSLQARNYLSKWRDSEGLYRYMLSLAPGVPVLHYSLANTLSELGKGDQAVEEYLKSIQASEGYADPHVGLGKALHERGDEAGAIGHFLAALRIHPDHLQAHDNLGAVLSAIGQTEEADLHLRRAILINPNYANPYYNLAMNLQRQGKPQEAVEQYGRALRANPGFYQAHANLARLFETLGQWDQAVYHYRLALLRSGGHPAIQERLTIAEKTLEELRRRGPP